MAARPPTYRECRSFHRLDLAARIRRRDRRVPRQRICFGRTWPPPGNRSQTIKATRKMVLGLLKNHHCGVSHIPSQTSAAACVLQYQQPRTGTRVVASSQSSGLGSSADPNCQRLVQIDQAFSFGLTRMHLKCAKEWLARRRRRAGHQCGSTGCVIWDKQRIASLCDCSQGG